MKVRYMKSIIEPFRLNGWNTADTTPTHPNQLNPLKSTNDECFFFFNMKTVYQYSKEIGLRNDTIYAVL